MQVKSWESLKIQQLKEREYAVTKWLSMARLLRSKWEPI